MIVRVKRANTLIYPITYRLWNAPGICRSGAPVVPRVTAGGAASPQCALLPPGLQSEKVFHAGMRWLSTASRGKRAELGELEESRGRRRRRRIDITSVCRCTAQFSLSPSVWTKSDNGERAFHSFRAQPTFFSVLSPWRGSAHQITLFTFLNFYSFLCFVFFVFVFCLLFKSADLKLYESSGLGSFFPPLKCVTFLLKDLRAWQSFFT